MTHTTSRIKLIKQDYENRIKFLLFHSKDFELRYLVHLTYEELRNHKLLTQKQQEDEYYLTKFPFL